MVYLWFLGRSLVGLLLSLLIFGTIFFPGALSGEVIHPLFIPFVGGMCIVAMAIPLAYFQRRITLSEKARRIVPFLFGLFWLPLMVAAGFILSPHSNVWVSGLRAGLFAALISSGLILTCLKLGDLIAKQKTSEDGG